MKTKIILWTISLWLFLMPLPWAYAETPIETIEGHIAEVLKALQDKSSKGNALHEAQEEKIWSIADSLFDFTELSRRALGRNWNKLDISQKKEFSVLFRKILGDLYMEKIMAYTDEKVSFGKEIMLSCGKAEVRSKIITRGREIPLHYRMILKNGQWRVYDFVVEGVSLVRNYRSQFKQILNKMPPEHLIEKLREKVRSEQSHHATRSQR